MIYLLCLNLAIASCFFYNMFTVGDYDVQIPKGTRAGDYSIRVGIIDNDALYGCSGVFEVSKTGEPANDDDSATSYHF